MKLPRLIDTPRLHLRDPRPADAQAMFDGYAADPAVLRYLGWRPHETVADTARHIGFDVHRWLKGSAWVWVMTLRDAAAEAGAGHGPVFGQIELVPMSHPSDAAHHLRLGYLMAPSHWRQGLMQEAVAAVLKTAFEQPAVWRVDALCDVDNDASAALLTRVGMLREGCLRRVVMHPNVSDQPRDAWVFATSRA